MAQNKPKLVAGLLFKDMGDEGILLNPNTSSYYRVTPLGGKILNLLMNESARPFMDDISTLANETEARTGMLVAKIQEDIHCFLKQLELAKIISF